MNPLSPEDAEDCGFCVFMRAGACALATTYYLTICLQEKNPLSAASSGPCGTEFRAWEECVKRYQNEDFAHKCVSATRALTTCMSQNKEYYEMPDLPSNQDKNSETTSTAGKHGNDKGETR